VIADFAKVFRISFSVVVIYFGMDSSWILAQESAPAGVDYVTLSVQNGGKISAVKLNGSSHIITAKVISSLSLSNASKYGFDAGSSMTLSDYYFSTKPIALVPGGFISSFSPPVPLGAIFINGRSISKPINTYLGAGMFCDDNGKYFIGDFNVINTQSFSDCIQSGPLFIQQGNVRYDSVSEISPDEQKLVRSVQMQTFACLTKTHDLILGISTEVKLDTFAEALKDKLGCFDAIRFTGYTTAGLYYWNGLVGYDRYPLTSVIALFRQ
jgi:hypothetical protein